MKRSDFKYWILPALFAGIIVLSCNSTPDSKEAAKDSNEVKFDKKDTAGIAAQTLEKDAEFAVNAADGGLMEVELGRLAQSNAASQQVKDFGQMMVQDHSKANDELKALAAQKNISLPDSLSSGKRKKYDELKELKGNRFDKKYISFMVSDHVEDIDDFKSYTGKGSDQDLVGWASGKLPVLEMHLQHARQTDSLLRK